MFTNVDNVYLQNKKVGKVGKVGKKVGKQFSCECGKRYSWRQSLWQHKKICKKGYDSSNSSCSDTDKEKEIEDLKKQLKAEKEAHKQTLVQVFEKNLEKDEKILEMAEKVGNKISINLYLNEHCKDAIPIMEFIKGLTFKLNDIDPERPLSTVESLSNVVVSELKQLDDTKRPIHCSDAKRLKFYVKDASNGWIKDEDNKKIDRAIGFANMRHQGAWHSHAKHEGLDKSKKDTDYHKMNVAMAKFSDDPKWAKTKIKRAIAGATNIKETKNQNLAKES
jgi:Fe-S-cluster formation regulator IscX/YfhJ